MAAPSRSVAPAHVRRGPHVWLLEGKDGPVRSDLGPRELADAVRSGAGPLWVDVDSTDRSQLALLEKCFHFHPLAIEDTLNPRSRSKVEEYEGYLFVVIRDVALDEATPDPYDLDTVTLFFFLGANYLVTVHAGPSRAVSNVFEQMARSAELLSRGAARLMHAVMDAAVDAFFPILDRIDEFTHEVEECVFVQFDPGALRDIFNVKRLVLSLRRVLGPERDVFNALTNRPNPLLPVEVQLYFRDIYDHVLRITDGLDTFRDLLSSTLDAYLTQVSNRLGVATKGLTLVATLSIPFVVVSGMWGMNVAHIPLSQAPHAFWLLLGVQVLIGVVLVALLRWRKWL